MHLTVCICFVQCKYIESFPDTATIRAEQQPCACGCRTVTMFRFELSAIFKRTGANLRSWVMMLRVSTIGVVLVIRLLLC